MLCRRARKQLSLVMFIGLVVLSAVMWDMGLTVVSGPPDGVHYGQSQGYQSDIELAVTVEDGRVVNIEVVAQDETPGISDLAYDQVIPAIIETQGPYVDVATGATVTSQAIITAFTNALESASP